MLFMSISAFAQVDTTSTSYGLKLNNNRNLRFTKMEKVHTEVSFGGHVSGGDITSYGVDLQAARVYTPSKSFAWGWGGLVSSEYSEDYGALADILGKVDIRLGSEKINLGIGILAGAGQMSFYDESTNGEDVARYYNSQWRFKVGAQAAVNFQLSKRVALSVFGRYLYAFNGEDNRSYQEAEGWTAAPTEYHTGKWSAGVSLSFTLGSEGTQISGDNCWNGGVYTGYSFEGSEGVILGAEMFHTKRTGAKGARVLGFGAEQVVGDNSTNSVFGKAGYQILPRGAKSPVIFEFGVKAGLGEYAKSEAGKTESGSYSMNSKIQSLGVVGKGYVGVNFHFGRHNIKLAGEAGYHTCFDTSFNGYGEASNSYNGNTSRLHGMDAAVTVGYSLAF